MTKALAAMKEYLLGFDAREMWLDTGTLWDEDRRNGYLLRQDVAKPLSTDTIVWPSVFDDGQGLGLDPVDREKLGFTGLDSPETEVIANGLWGNLNRLRVHVDRQVELKSKSFWIVGISVIERDDTPYPQQMLPSMQVVNPPHRHRGWKILGYDVSDAYMLSALTNCGYSDDDERKTREADYTGRLNQYHLFENATDAASYVPIANSTVIEHAPFFVYGLWLIDSHDAL